MSQQVSLNFLKQLEIFLVQCSPSINLPSLIYLDFAPTSKIMIQITINVFFLSHQG